MKMLTCPAVPSERSKKYPALRCDGPLSITRETRVRLGENDSHEVVMTVKGPSSFLLTCNDCGWHKVGLWPEIAVTFGLKVAP